MQNKTFMKKQNIFNYKFSLGSSEDNFFVNNTNKDAYDGILFNQNNSLFLSGPAKSGKSCIGELWKNKHKAIKYKNNFEYLITLKRNILIDDFEEHNEEYIFHLINYTQLNKLKILLISKSTLYDIKIQLNDLSSRIKVFDSYFINNPDDEMLFNVLTKLVVDKQFIINSSEVFDYIIKRMSRSYEDLYNLVNKMDTLSLEKKRQLTIPLIKEIL